MIVTHLTTVHSRYDNRILNKECSSLAKKLQVNLIVCDGKGDEEFNGVRIIDAGRPRNRWHRMFLKTWKVYSIARQKKSQIYHFHDPELMLLGLLYKIFGAKVIYDIHEDYKTSILQKKYLPFPFRFVLAFVMVLLEKIASKAFYCVIAEKYYRERFPQSTQVLNYPKVTELINIDAFDASSNRLIYTGNVTEDRGASLMLDAACKISQVSFKIVGKWQPRELEKVKNLNLENIELIGEGEFVPFSEITTHYQAKAMVGIALFPPTDHYLKKELTKFFEYMSVGLPIIASNFPVWEQLIKKNGLGFCIDPQDDQALLEAITWIQSHPSEALEMGQRGKELVQNQFNWHHEEKKLIGLYESLL